MKTKLIKTSADHFLLRTLLVFRVLLGLGLFIKGIQLIKLETMLRQAIASSQTLADYFWLQTFVPWVNLIGGFFIIIGLFTRLAALVNIPVITGAILYINIKQGAFSGDNELAFSIVILVLLVFYLFEGPGPVSLDKWMRKQKNPTIG